MRGRGGCDGLSLRQGEPVHVSEVLGSSQGLWDSSLGGAHGGVAGWVRGLQSFNATLKNERVYRMVYPTKDKAMNDIASWIELRYNQIRLHSALGYRTPDEVESEFLDLKKAA